MAEARGNDERGGAVYKAMNAAKDKANAKDAGGAQRFAKTAAMVFISGVVSIRHSWPRTHESSLVHGWGFG